MALRLLQCLTGRWCGKSLPRPNVIALQLPVKRGTADAEHLSRQGLITLHLFENSLDSGAFNVFQIGGTKTR